MKTIDYIIVGQGLAGSVLAYTLMQHQQKVLVVDEDIKKYYLSIFS